MKVIVTHRLALVLFALTFGVQAAWAAKAPKVEALFFSAPWCSPCKNLVPALEARMRDGLKDLEEVHVTLYVETGQLPNQEPTQEIADAYAKELKTTFTPVPDPWRFTTYRKYFPGVSVRIPAMVLLSAEDGEVIKSYPAGELDPDEAVMFLRDYLEN